MLRSIKALETMERRLISSSGFFSKKSFVSEMKVFLKKGESFCADLQTD